MAIFLVWSVMTEIDEMVRGSGRVVPSSQTKIIQHLEGGIVEKIYHKESDHVKIGDPIYKLSNAFSHSSRKQKEIELLSLKLQKKRLKAQISFAKSFDINDDSTLNAKNEKEIFDVQMMHYKQQKSILQNKLDQSKLERKQKKSQLKNLHSELKIAEENLDILKKLLSKGAASKKQYLADLAKTQNLITRVSEIKNEIPIIDRRIKEAQTTVATHKSQKRSDWLKELSSINLKIDQISQKNIADGDREDRKIVTSPVNGIVKKLYFSTVGGIIKPGDRVAEITPIEDILVVEAKIDSIDRAHIWVDQNVSIEITAYNYAKYGLLKGKLISISPDSFIDNATGSSFYQVKVKADHYEFAKDKLILPGMIANINILTGKKKIMEYLLKPLKDITINALTEK
jgi:HlyD family secretion protein/adhesin transport system membrane fusion protein